MTRAILASALVLSACIKDPPFSPLNTIDNPPDPASLEGETQLDRITQVNQPSVDVLFVVDSSCSMAEEQAALGANFSSFMSWFVDSALDYHIGVVSTDMLDPGQSGRLVSAGGYRWVDQDTPNPEGIFTQMTTLGTNGSIDEKGFAATMAALTDPLASRDNGGFYRDEADLFVVFVSDADDNSAPAITTPEFRNFMRTLKEDEEKVTVSAIVGTPQSSCVIELEGTAYANLANSTGGDTFDICQDDWRPVLDELGQSASAPRSEFYLTDIPVLETLEVLVIDDNAYYEGRLQDTECELCAFTYSYNDLANSIVFLDYVPSALAEIEIRYETRRGVR